MKMYKKKTWQHEITGADGDTILFGVNIFDYKWERTGRIAKVKDPVYNFERKLEIYNVVIANKKYEFAAGEFSNYVWGFYIEKW